MKPLHVVLAAGLYPPDIGGPATYAAMIAKELPQHGITVTVVPYHAVRKVPKPLRHLAYTLRLWWKARKANVVYTLDPVSVGVPALLVSKVRRLPLLLRVGGDYAWEQGSQRFGVTDTLDGYTKHRAQAPLLVRGLHRLQAKVAKAAAMVVVPSVYLSDIVETWGVAPERIAVVYSALTKLPVSMSTEEARRHFNLAGFVIVTAARLTPWKGVAALFPVLSHLREDGIDAKLVIAGDGPLRKHLEVEAGKYGVLPHVDFLGGITKTELGNLLTAADAFVLNTAYEGLSHQLLEVMAAKVPVVTTTVGGNPELIEDGVSGLLVAYNDVPGLTRALATLAVNHAYATKLTTGASVALAPFNHTDSLNALVRIITNHATR